jgi:hypothetical protein
MSAAADCSALRLRQLWPAAAEQQAHVRERGGESESWPDRPWPRGGKEQTSVAAPLVGATARRLGSEDGVARLGEGRSVACGALRRCAQAAPEAIPSEAMPSEASRGSPEALQAPFPPPGLELGASGWAAEKKWNLPGTYDRVQWITKQTTTQFGIQRA